MWVLFMPSGTVVVTPCPSLKSLEEVSGLSVITTNFSALLKMRGWISNTSCVSECFLGGIGDDYLRVRISPVVVGGRGWGNRVLFRYCRLRMALEWAIISIPGENYWVCRNPNAGCELWRYRQVGR